MVGRFGSKLPLGPAGPTPSGKGTRRGKPRVRRGELAECTGCGYVFVAQASTFVVCRRCGESGVIPLQRDKPTKPTRRL